MGKLTNFILLFFLFLTLTGCASNQHLVFFTNSSIGIDISSEPETATPFKFVVGYKRQEGVIDPIGTGYAHYPLQDTSLPLQPSDKNSPVLATKVGYFVQKGTSDKPHSVIAKMNFGASGGGSNASAAQWFATGKAAEILAQQPGIAGAVAGDPKVNETAKVLGLKTDDKMASFASLSQIYQNLEKIAETQNSNSEKAKKIVAHVDTLADEGMFNVPIIYYSFNINKKELKIVPIDDPAREIPGKGFKKVIAYTSKIKSSLDHAKNAAKSNQINKTGGKDLSEKERKMLVENIISYQEMYKNLLKTIGSNSDVIEMVEFYCQNVLLTEK